MDWGLVAAFMGVSILLLLTPGVDWAYIISSGVKGKRSMRPAVAGVLAGHVTATLLVAAGVAAIFATSAAVMLGLTIAGAAYMVWLGVQTLRQPPSRVDSAPGQAAPGSTAPGTAAQPAWRLFFKGMGLNLLNPKTYLFFLALLPQFTSPDSALPVGLQILVLGAFHMVACTAIYLAVGYGASTILVDRARVAELVRIVSGVVLVVFGLVLFIEQILAVG